MRLLIADKLHPVGVEELKHLGVEVIEQPELPPESLAAFMAEHDVGILVVRSKVVTAEAIQASRSLGLIVRAGHGVGNIDVAAASAAGVYVASCKGRNAVAVAELTMAMILALDRRIPDAVASIRSGRWEKGEFAKAEGLQGKKIGILGLGAVGYEVLTRVRAFGMVPFGWSRGLTPQRARELDIIPASSPKDLASRVDILTVHLAANRRTRGIVSRQVLEALPDGAMFLNIARGELVDQEALIEVAKAKHLRVALDVYADFPHVPSAAFDPPKFDDQVLWYGTPHIGSQTEQAKKAVALETSRIVRAYMVEGRVPNAVNVRTSNSARYQIVIRHRDKVGSLANSLLVLKRHGINVEELSTNVFEQGGAACTRLNVVTRPSDACLQEMAVFQDEILHVDLVTLPILA